MRLSKKVSTIIVKHTQELSVLLQFVKDFDTYISQHKFQRANDIFIGIPDRIKSEFMQYYHEFLENAQKVLNEIKEYESSKGEKTWIFKTEKDYQTEVQRYLIPFLVAVYRPFRYPDLLYPMALTHAVAIFESFLSDFLVAIFTERPNTLKSNNTVTYEEILSFSSRKELIEALAINRAEKIINDNNIDDVVKLLRDLFSVDLSKANNFDILREASYRRNIIIHNGGVTDKKYCERIPNSQIGARLSTDFQYIETLFIAIGQFIDYLDDFFSRKMRYRRNQIVNQLLNPPESISESHDNSP